MKRALLALAALMSVASLSAAYDRPDYDESPGCNCSSEPPPPPPPPPSCPSEPEDTTYG